MLFPMGGMRGRRGRFGARRLTLIASLAAVLLYGLPATGGVAASPTDRAATDAYLTATYTLYRAILADEPRSKVAAETLLARFGHECPGVLAAAPQESGGTTSKSLGPRARGEADRQVEQLAALRFELSGSLLAAIYGPDRPALSAWAQTVRGLRWSNPRLASLVASSSAVLEEESSYPVSDVCADMRAWVASGYRRITATTKEYEARFFALLRRAFAAGGLSPTGVQSLLERYEDRRGRALARGLAALELRLSDGRGPIRSVKLHPGRLLGLKEEEEPPERTRGTIVGSGVTAAGGSYVIRIERGPAALGANCRWVPSVEYSSPSAGFSGFSVSSSSSSNGCTPAGRPGPAPVSCEQGLLTVEYRTTAAVRRVRLALSDGRTITSSVAPIPQRLGGPAGFYYEALRGPWPVPVSLTELDRDGHTLSVVRLRAPRDCRQPPEPVSLELAHGQAPDGSPFAIVGTSFRSGPHGQFLLRLSDQTRTTGEEPHGQAAKILSWRIGASCAPSQHGIVYGVLAAPGDTVLARTPTGLLALSGAPIPARLHAGGSLVYGAFAAIPSELVVLDAAGRTVYSKSLLAQDAEHHEYCEGYAEP